jgi:hypothetical protein
LLLEAVRAPTLTVAPATRRFVSPFTTVTMTYRGRFGLRCSFAGLAGLFGTFG